MVFYSIRTSKQDALVVQRVAPALPREGALEPGQVVVGRLAHYVAVELAFRKQRTDSSGILGASLIIIIT